MACVYTLRNGTSRSQELMHEIRQVWELIEHHRIRFTTRYIHTLSNVEADALSREIDGENWALGPRLVQFALSWAPTIDRFASPGNAIVPRFNTRWEAPGSEGTDALSIPDHFWRQERNFCHPPYSLMTAVVTKIKRSGAAALVVAPIWEQKPWYAELKRMAARTYRFKRVRDTFTPVGPRARKRYGSPRWDVGLFDVPARTAGYEGKPSSSTQARERAPVSLHA